MSTILRKASEALRWSTVIRILAAFIVPLALPLCALPQTVTVLHSFNGADGYGPYSGLIADESGNLYGTIGSGGESIAGDVYQLDPTGHLTILHSFTENPDGSSPYAGLTRDAQGNLYGTTAFGGASNVGIVFKLDASGQETILHTFTGIDGAHPYSGVVRDAAGNLFGTTDDGGASGFGIVYELDASGNEKVLHTFTGGADGKYPFAGVILDEAGNLYGTTRSGGPYGYGVVYKIDPSGNETIVYAFGGILGGNLYAGVIRDAKGNLYGAARNAGDAVGGGVVFKLDTIGNETVLHRFGNGFDGRGPGTTLTLDGSGNLWGVTWYGGAANYGTVFRIDTDTMKETVVHSFAGPEGAYPIGQLLIRNGRVFGTTYDGGSNFDGEVFEVSFGAGN